MASQNTNLAIPGNASSTPARPPRQGYGLSIDTLEVLPLIAAVRNPFSSPQALDDLKAIWYTAIPNCVRIFRRNTTCPVCNEVLGQAGGRHNMTEDTQRKFAQAQEAMNAVDLYNWGLSQEVMDGFKARWMELEDVCWDEYEATACREKERGNDA